MVGKRGVGGGERREGVEYNPVCLQAGSGGLMGSDASASVKSLMGSVSLVQSVLHPSLLSGTGCTHTFMI